MILQRLMEYAARQPETLPSGYQNDLIQKEIRLHTDGSFRDVVSLSGEKRGLRTGRVESVPRLVRSSGVRPILIADNAKYALNVVDEGDKPDRAAECHEAYTQLVEHCAAITGDDRVAAYASFLRSPDKERARAQVLPGDNVIVSVGGDLLTDIPTVRAFWAEPKEGLVATCLVTGIETKVEERMPVPIKGIPGGQSSGMQLVSVNFDAAESHGLKYALNSPISRVAGEAFANGLNALIEGRDTSLRIGNTLYLFWTRQGGNPLMSLFNDPQASDVLALLESVKKGERQVQPEAKDFFMLVVSAYGPRVVIRDYLETSLDIAKAGLAEWFGKTAIYDLDGDQRTFGYRRLASSLFREEGDVPEHVGTALLRSALLGSLLPKSMLALAVRRNQAMQGPYAVFNGRRFLDLPRLAVIQAALGVSPEFRTMEQFSTETERAAYQCGRLLAALDRIQYHALKSVNATLTDRFYGAASTSPMTVFPTLIKTAQAHISKVRREKRMNLHPRLEEILQPVFNFPAKLTIAEQGLFALGFYHERARRRKPEEPESDEVVNPTDPE